MRGFTLDAIPSSSFCILLRTPVSIDGVTLLRLLVGYWIPVVARIGKTSAVDTSGIDDRGEGRGQDDSLYGSLVMRRG